MDEKPQKPETDNGEIREESVSRGQSAGENEASAGLQLELVKQELEKAKSEYLYLLAEFENYKKHVIKERSDMRKYGAERLLVELLSVLDIFETALRTEVTPANLTSFHKGVELTANEFKGTLQRFGVEELPAEGQPFDPNIHEAISSEATDSVPEGYISKVYKKPFKLHDRVIRPGQVVVASKPKS